MSDQLIIKWRTHWGERINRVECLKETPQKVWRLTDIYSKDGRHLPRPTCENKSSNHHSYHDTWEEAHAHLMRLAELEVQSSRRRLEQANSKLGNIKGMKKP